MYHNFLIHSSVNGHLGSFHCTWFHCYNSPSCGKQCCSERWVSGSIWQEASCVLFWIFRNSLFLINSCCCCCCVTSVVSAPVRPHRRQPPRLSHPWDSPGKNTGVGCHFLHQCMKVKSESEVTQLCPTLRDPMDCSLPGSSVHGIFQARVLEWVAIAFSD